MLKITEVFHSIQGEGPLSGRPAVFLRLSGCVPPLCPWCDTIYSCGDGESYSVGEAYNMVASYNCKLIVITGGEPFLQWENGLLKLEEMLIQSGFEIQYETSGKVQIPSESKAFIVCSPKHLENKWQFVDDNIGKADAFKFVVENDFEIVREFTLKHQIPKSRIWIMPMGTTSSDQLRLMPSVWNFCVENGFRFSPRLHTLAFDNKRGV